MKYVKTIICVAIAGALIVGYYYYLSTRNATETSEEKGEELTEVEDLLTTDLENDYPPTPREVIKLYNRILQAYYNEELTDSQVEQLASFQWNMFDEKLKEANPWDTFLGSVKSDITLNHEMERAIIDVSVSDSSDIIYKVVDGQECAIVTTSYFVEEGNSFEKSYQDYALLQDDDKNWRIVAFELSDSSANRNDDE